MFKVCILTAGRGSRLLPYTDTLNKALLPIGTKAAISHIVDKFKPYVEIVVALGFDSYKVSQYLLNAYPDRKFTFVQIENYDEPGSGPGASLLKCRQYLSCPFIFCAVDTVVTEKIPNPINDWMGVASIEKKKSSDYCTVFLKNKKIVKLDDKVKNNSELAFIGLAGINSHEQFWDGLSATSSLVDNEFQVTNGFRALKEMSSVKFSWYDTGSLNGLEIAQKDLSGNIDLLSKENEATYLLGKRYVKHFSDKKVIQNRYERSKLLKGFCPNIDIRTDDFYSYDMVSGTTLYNHLSSGTVSDFLQWMDTYIWSNKIERTSAFDKACKKFYWDKSQQRLEDFLRKNRDIDDHDSYCVNNVDVESAKLLLKNAYNEIFNTAIPSKLFHGDLQFDNIVLRSTYDDFSKKYCLLDWRQDFGGAIQFGDIYYDLAKMYGGLTMPYDLIKKGRYSIAEDKNNVFCSWETHSELKECREAFETFVNNRSYSLRVIKLLRAMIFINMSPLHEQKLGRLLYFTGREYMQEAISGC